MKRSVPRGFFSVTTHRLTRNKWWVALRFTHPTKAMENTDPNTSAQPLWSRLIERALAFLQRRPWLLPLLSFSAGWISFALVQRGERMARGIAVLVLLGWIGLLAEDFLSSWIVRLSRGQLSEKLLYFATQSLQQEIFFFALPFLIGATHGDPGQMIFCGIVVIAALASTLDPIYMTRIASAGSSSVLFHAFCSFLAGLVVLPIALQLPLEKAVPLSLALTAALSLLCVPRMFAGVSRRRGMLRIGVVLTLLVLTWFARSHIPPAGLWVKQAVITASVSDDLEPGPALQKVAAADLAAGVNAFVAIHAPLGLAQSVTFEWVHEGDPLDRIAATIKGGREAGYRTYSRKQNFPLNSPGHWTVNLRTPDGQLICRMDFEVE